VSGIQTEIRGATLNCGEGSFSVAIEDIEPADWAEVLFVALPADAVNEVIIQGSVFIGMLQFNYSVKYFGKDQGVAAYTLPSATNATCCGTPPSSARPSGKAPTS
jgi:hypothetical protein